MEERWSLKDYWRVFRVAVKDAGSMLAPAGVVCLLGTFVAVFLSKSSTAFWLVPIGIVLMGLGALVERDDDSTTPKQTEQPRSTPVIRGDYAAYLASPAWQVKRRGALERADYRCQLCNSRYRLEVHHSTYRRLGMERDSDLIVLCSGCHARFHDKLDE